MTDTPTVTTHAGVVLPQLIYGTAWKKADTARLVTLALATGFRGIDTACQPKHYDEAGVGAGLAASGLPRDAVYVQTKFTPLSGQDPARVPYDPDAPLPEQVQQSVAQSLRNLRVDHLDGLVLHSPLRDMADTLRAWRAMEAHVDAGRVRQLGISNCYALPTLERLWREARVRPAIVQNRFYADSGYDVAIRAWCRANGVVYQSFWTLTANPQLLASHTLATLARTHRCAPAQILFRWLTQDGAVPLTGTRSEIHMRADLAMFDFALSSEERASINALLPP